MDGTTNKLHVVLEQISKFNGKKAGDFLKWSSKLRASLSIYNRAIINILQGQKRPSETGDSQATARAAWDVANQDLFSMLLFSTGDSAFYVVRRFEGTTVKDRAGHGQQTWAALREKFKGGLGKAIRAEHSKMNNTRMRSDQDPYWSTFTSRIAAEIALTRATHQTVPQMVSMRIYSCMLYRSNMRPFDKPTYREENPALPISGV